VALYETLSVLWCCWLGLMTCKTVSRITYTVLVETLNPAQSNPIQSSIFDLGPLSPKIDSPKCDTKSPITRLVWQIDQRCLGLDLLGGFRGWPNGRFNGTIQNVVGPTLVAMATKIWQILGYFFLKNRFFFFVSRRNRAVFGPSVLHMALYKTLFFDFWFRPPNAKNLLPKICTCTKSPITRLVCETDQRCFHLLGGFRGWPI